VHRVVRDALIQRLDQQVDDLAGLVSSKGDIRQDQPRARLPVVARHRLASRHLGAFEIPPLKGDLRQHQVGGGRIVGNRDVGVDERLVQTTHLLEQEGRPQRESLRVPELLERGLVGRHGLGRPTQTQLGEGEILPGVLHCGVLFNDLLQGRHRGLEIAVGVETVGALDLGQRIDPSLGVGQDIVVGRRCPTHVAQRLQLAPGLAVCGRRLFEAAIVPTQGRPKLGLQRRFRTHQVLHLVGIL